MFYQIYWIYSTSAVLYSGCVDGQSRGKLTSRQSEGSYSGSLSTVSIPGALASADGVLRKWQKVFAHSTRMRPSWLMNRTDMNGAPWIRRGGGVVGNFRRLCLRFAQGKLYSAMRSLGLPKALWDLKKKGMIIIVTVILI